MVSFSDTDWTSSYPECGGSRQSPIDIDPYSTTSANYSDFTFSLGYKIVMTGSLVNNGYACMPGWSFEILDVIIHRITIAVEFNVDPKNRASIYGGPLTGTYNLDHFDIHWGSRQGQGAEHKIDEERWESTGVRFWPVDWSHLYFQLWGRTPVNSLQVILW